MNGVLLVFSVVSELFRIISGTVNVKAAAILSFWNRRILMIRIITCDCAFTSLNSC